MPRSSVKYSSEWFIYFVLSLSLLMLERSPFIILQIEMSLLFINANEFWIIFFGSAIWIFVLCSSYSFNRIFNKYLFTYIYVVETHQRKLFSHARSKITVCNFNEFNFQFALFYTMAPASWVRFVLYRCALFIKC